MKSYIVLQANYSVFFAASFIIFWYRDCLRHIPRLEGHKIPNPSPGGLAATATAVKGTREMSLSISTPIRTFLLLTGYGTCDGQWD